MEGVFICFVGHTLRYRPTTALPCEGRKKKNRRVVLLCDAAALLLQMGSCFSSCCRGLFLSFGALAQCVGCNESQDHSHNHHDDRDDKVVTGTGGVNVGRQLMKPGVEITYWVMPRIPANRPPMPPPIIAPISG